MERFALDAQGLTNRDQRQFFIPSFRWGIDGGAVGVVSSYNVIDGTPSTCSHKVLTDILRGEWGLDVRHSRAITDTAAADFIQSYHHSVNTSAEAALVAITAGVDVELACCDALAVFGTPVDAVSLGMLAEEVLDRGVFRVVVVMLHMGALDSA